MPENEEVVSVFWACKNQVIVDPSGRAIDISFPSVKIMMDLLNVSDQQTVFQRVVELFYHCLKANFGGDKLA